MASPSFKYDLAGLGVFSALVGVATAFALARISAFAAIRIGLATALALAPILAFTIVLARVSGIGQLTYSRAAAVLVGTAAA